MHISMYTVALFYTTFYLTLRYPGITALNHIFRAARVVLPALVLSLLNALLSFLYLNNVHVPTDLI